MIPINIILLSGKLYITINVDSLELTYLQVKELFNDLDARFYKIVSGSDIIITNFFISFLVKCSK